MINIAKTLRPSKRGEFEITDINKEYLKKGKLELLVMGRGHMWFDVGTHESITEAGYYIKKTEENQDLKLGCIEEVAFRKGYINQKQLKKIASSLNNSNYGKYLFRVATEDIKMDYK